MSQSFKAAAALILIGAGGFLVFRGIREYVDSQHVQRTLAKEWRPPSMERQTPNQPPAFIPEGTPFSRLDVPRLRASLYVVEGDNEQSLKEGPGHVRGTAMPGQNGNCVIAGHRDMHFRFLRNIQAGDRVYLETAQGKFCYKVTGTKIVRPTQIEVLQPTPDAQLHLITCYPFYFLGHAPKRFVVTAQLDPSETQMASAKFVPPPATRITRPRPVEMAKMRRRPGTLETSNYDRSLEATRALNRAAADGDE